MKARRIAELMTSEPACVTAADSGETAARRMAEHDCGALPVVTPQGEPIAMVTDRDLCMKAYRHERSLGEIEVRDAMSQVVFACGADDAVEEAANLMRTSQVRRLPVVDGEGRLCGVVSLADLALEAGDDPAAQAIVGRTLGGVCRPTRGRSA